MLVFSIDPGTGASSPTAIAAFDPMTKQISFTRNLWTEMKGQHHVLHDLTSQMRAWYRKLRALRKTPIMVVSETFVMRGKGGETLQRLIGAYESACPLDYWWRTVYNTAVKKHVSGNGDGDKLYVALGVKYFFMENEASKKYVEELIMDEEWDRTDALAIGIAGWIQEQYLTDDPNNPTPEMAAIKLFERADKTLFLEAEVVAQKAREVKRQREKQQRKEHIRKGNREYALASAARRRKR